MGVARTLVLFALAALAEIGGAWLIWQGVREHRGAVFVGFGVAALGVGGVGDDRPSLAGISSAAPRREGRCALGSPRLAARLRGLVATLQEESSFGRVLAAYGGIFVAGSLGWGMVVDGFRPDRWDVAGAAICLVGVAVIMFAPGRA